MKRVGYGYRRTYYSLASAVVVGAAVAAAVLCLESVDISSFYPLSSCAWAFVLRKNGWKTRNRT